MKVFISWSGSKSGKFAKELSAWIPDVIQDVECFISQTGIEAGQQWLQVINSELASTDFGVICVTADNQNSSWLNFESGALAKKLGDGTRVVPVVIDFPIGSLDYPLRQFNGVSPDHDGLLVLIRSINSASPNRKDESVLVRAFEQWWPNLEKMLELIGDEEEPVVAPEPPDVGALLEETLTIVRSISANLRQGYTPGIPGDLEASPSALLAALARRSSRYSLWDGDSLTPSSKFLMEFAKNSPKLRNEDVQAAEFVSKLRKAVRAQEDLQDEEYSRLARLVDEVEQTGPDDAGISGGTQL
ncbi:toll/interleukin-1 receptor domain-containing protein [Agreia sp. Leaf283]|uniref:toll/interleukin-1 receptor domain-containing protein n=1 Tax=Agreia sp. Leaf283 TaxID=1736321 RepID=UPI000A875FA2|nr:toll/interleukin-1 receptor domain-containing protein [Agreia sp. Leaf283]